MRNGFSLVELSIVLVILGLLTGGILAGQSLIRAAELRSITAELDRYYSATQSFRDKYMSIPGDFRDATRFWARYVNAAHCATNSSASVGTPGTCDGDGDGIIEAGAAASQSGEFLQFWRQLALAGLIEGDYSGIAGSGGNWHALRGTNSPASKLSNAGWGTWYAGTLSGDTVLFDGAYGNMFIMGTETGTGNMSGATLKPEEAWSIDTKIDDGKPAIGRVAVRIRANCALSAAGAALTTSVADAAKIDAIYNLASGSVVCIPLFRGMY